MMGLSVSLTLTVICYFLELNDLAAISSYLGSNRRSLTSVITEALALQRQINHF